MPKTPDFQKLEKVRVIGKKKNMITIGAEAVYMNENAFGGRLKEVDMDIFVEGQKITHLSQDKDIAINENAEFRVPITFQVDLNDFSKKEKGLLNGTLSKILKDEVEIKYKGTLKVTLLDTDIKVPVDFSEKLSIGLNWK